MIRGMPASPALALLLACGPSVGTSGETESGADSSTGRDDDSSTSSTSDPSTTAPGDTGMAPTRRQVDLIVVIDNSGTMAEEQRAAAEQIRTLAAELTASDVDYRIAFTTSDNGNPWCTTTPEGGAFRATSCFERLEDFTFFGAEVIDGSSACTETCLHEEIEILPTPTVADPEPRPRRWLENIGGVTNVSIDPLEALSCMLPQGISGCGFEAPLESMNKAILRTESEDEAQFGFHDPGALLAVLVMTDELDCSTNPDHDIVFLPEGDRVFWSIPSAPAPTSAVCWNAGVRCEGLKPFYGSCESVDLTRTGGPAASEQSAVVRPVKRYVDALQARNAFFAAIAGVPVGYVDGDAEIEFFDAADELFQTDFGIGPSCSSPEGLAIPPVRIRDLDDALGPTRNLYSICDVASDSGIERFTEQILDRLPR